MPYKLTKSGKLHIPENLVYSQISTWLDLHKICWHPVPNKGRYMQDKRQKGAPDMVCCINGRYVGIELKSSSGRQSVAQKEFEQRIKNAGGIYFLVRDVKDLAALCRGQKMSTGVY